MTNNELRKKIAKLHGYEIISQTRNGVTLYQLYWHGDLINGSLSTDESALWNAVPNWTEDISAAWKLVEEMRDADCTIVLTRSRNNQQDHCHVKPLTPGSLFYGSFADTIPLAISEVWYTWKSDLLAKGVSEIEHPSPDTP